MAFVTIPETHWPNKPATWSSVPNIAGSTNLDLNGSGQWAAWVGQVKQTATIDRYFFRVAAATTGCDALVRIETVDTSTGLPTGTLYHANATDAVTIGTGAADYANNFDGTFSLAQGDFIAFVISVSSGTPSGVQFGLFDDDGAGVMVPYLIDFDAAAAIRTSGAICAGLGISGGGAVCLPKMWPINAASNETYNSGSSPDTIGNRIVVDAPIRVAGAFYWVDQDADATLKLYDTDGSTVLASANLYTAVPPLASSQLCEARFSSSIELAAGTYWIAIEATSGSNIGLSTITFVSSTWRSGSPFGADKITYAACTQTPANTGSWTVTETKQAMIGLIIDGIDDGTSTGGGTTAHVFMA